MNRLRVFLIVFGFILTIGLMIPALFYIVNFWGGGLSKDPQIWGTFGDYFGGLFNPILALANLIIFIKLTMIVADMQDKTTRKALNFEKKILTSGLMHDSIKELSEILNSLGQKIITNRQQTDWEILKVQQTVTTFGNNYTHLFTNIDNRNILNELNNLLIIVRARPYNQQNFATSFNNYLDAKDRYIQLLHRQTILKLDN